MLLYNGLNLNDKKGLVVDSNIFNNYTEKELKDTIMDQFLMNEEILEYILKTSQIGIFTDDVLAYKAYCNNESSVFDKDLLTQDNFAQLKLYKTNTLTFIYVKE